MKNRVRYVPNPSGLCLCGCGDQANLDWKGRPQRYIKNHINRGRRPANYKGKTIHSNGYVRLRTTDHPRAQNGYVYEHILIAERVLGRPLPIGAQIHHVNENTGDNCPSNLVICEGNAYHALLHRRRRALTASDHADWMRCCYCKQWDDPARMSQVRTRPSVAYHKQCIPKDARPR